MDTPLAWYTTREAVKAALDVKTTARSDRQVDKCIAAASRSVEGALHRRFYPWTGTKYFPWPTTNGSSYRIDCDEHGIISVTLILSGGVEVTVGSYFLEPANDGPPYDSIELDLGDVSGFNAGDTPQRNVAVTGLWGYTLDERTAGATTEALDTSETGVDVDAATASAVGVGSVLRIGSERLTVVGRSLVDTTVNIGANMTDSKSGVAVSVASGAAFAVDEVLLIDSERVRIVDIAGNTLIVERAYDGTILAAHTSGADIYAYRTLTCERGSLGTTAAAHDTASPVLLWYPPALVEEFTVAVAETMLGQRQAGYARTVGSGESERESAGRGVAQIRKDAVAAHGRMARTGAV